MVDSTGPCVLGTGKKVRPMLARLRCAQRPSCACLIFCRTLVALGDGVVGVVIIS
jgi:hypothetical protein